MKKQTKIWKTKDGRKIRICDMTDQHLLNSIKLLIRAGERVKTEVLNYYPSFNGEMAQMEVDRQLDMIIEMDPVDFAESEYPILTYLLFDAERRKLNLTSIYG